MKFKNAFVLSALVAFGTQVVQARDSTGQSENDSAPQPTIVEVRLSKLMDANVRSHKGEDLGRLEDIILDPQSGKIDFAILGRGGFLGIGEKYVPVPWKAIRLQSNREFTLNVDKDRLQTAPTTDKEYSNLNEPEYTVSVYKFFDVPPATGAAESPGGIQSGGALSTNAPPDSSETLK